MLLNVDYYHAALKPLLAEWAFYWLQKHHLIGLSRDEALTFIRDGAHSKLHPELAAKLNNTHAAASDGGAGAARAVDPQHVRFLTLARDWLNSYLPHCLTKINRVSFGIFSADDHARALALDPYMPRSRAKLAIPFVGKDVPSRSSEFAHPDVIIGLTILAYRYSGMRYSDFDAVIGAVRTTFDKEIGPYKRRKSSVTYEKWVVAAGGRIKGGFAASAATASASSSPETASAANGGAGGGGDLHGQGGNDHDDVAAAAAAYEQVGEVVPLRLLRRSNNDQMAKLFALLRQSPGAIHWYLEQFVFPEFMRHQKIKLSASGQEVGGDLLFPRRIGFSGTPSDLLPVELGKCGYEQGSDGLMVQVLTDPRVCDYELVASEPQWTVESLLRAIADADGARTEPIRSLIDTGALITGLSNLQVAAALLGYGMAWCEGVVFLDEYDRKMILVRATGRVVKLETCGVPAERRFAFYDQVHTTGMDIKHHDAAVAALTLGKDMTFRDLAQGAFRMRGIAKGQRVRMLIIPEVEDLIARELAAAKLPAPPTRALSQLDSLLAPAERSRRVLTACVAWLTINAMRAERVQFNQLCVQNVTNVFRKVIG